MKFCNIQIIVSLLIYSFDSVGGIRNYDTFLINYKDMKLVPMKASNNEDLNWLAVDKGMGQNIQKNNLNTYTFIPLNEEQKSYIPINSSLGNYGNIVYVPKNLFLSYVQQKKVKEDQSNLFNFTNEPSKDTIFYIDNNLIYFYSTIYQKKLEIKVINLDYNEQIKIPIINLDQSDDKLNKLNKLELELISKFEDYKI